ncbi:TNF receptor-associated factor 4-like [Halichondria panicea]|uniref:TNF receptor-associated factor 4-like n=1 Tax=Halichondria panicea TaxID=6063 RepID=UPI00312BAD83
MATPNPEPVFVKELAEKYKCSICLNLLDTPVLTECCGQHFCKACIEDWIITNKESTCPHCRAENFKKIVSQPKIRKIKELEVNCTNDINGCKAIIKFRDFQKHVDECPFGGVECTNDCGTGGLLRKNLQLHCKQECPNRIVHCKLCNKEGKHSVIVGEHKQECPNRIVHCKLCNEKGEHLVIVGEHKGICPKVVVACPNKCNEKLKRKDIKEHKNECRLEIVDCPFKKAGCKASLPRKDIAEHRNECPFEIVDCPFKEAGCEARLLRKDISEHKVFSMLKHLRLTLNMWYILISVCVLFICVCLYNER